MSCPWHKAKFKIRTGEVLGTPVALFNVGGAYHAIHNICLHEDGSLGEGDLSHASVACPLHFYVVER